MMDEVNKINLITGAAISSSRKGERSDGNMLFVDNKMCCYINPKIRERKCDWVGAGTGCG